ncbi:MAG: HisA/HisF-related TIM barrel protein [Promethearchaeota archaeon]|jgi:dihydroorotate dehydrogenase
MKLRNVEYGSVFCGSGLMGYYGEGYKYHKLFKMIPGFNFNGLTFVAKTITVKPHKGYGKIVIKPIKGAILNSIGVHNPGIFEILKARQWQCRSKPFMISFISISNTVEQRLVELENFVKIISEESKNFITFPAIQLNFSCPNIKQIYTPTLYEISKSLEIASKLNTPLLLKFNITISTNYVLEISKLKNCDAICVSNTIPWGRMPKEIDWNKLFGKDISPLKKYGGGGLSGKPISHLVCNWVNDIKKKGIKKPIMAGGGILSKNDVINLYKAGADSIFIGSIAILRPWRIKSVIKMNAIKDP